MPTYEYRCCKCGHEFEEFQSIKAQPLKTCPKCKGRVQRIVTGGSGVIFKGSGFYITDYARANVKTHGRPGVADSGKDSEPKKEPDKKKESESKKDSSSGKDTAKKKD